MAYTSDAETREWLRGQIDIVRLARDMVGDRLRRQGAVHRGPCPCCGAGESQGKAPFLVDPRPTPKYPHYKCFACDDKGDVFTLFARHRNLSLKNDFPRIIAGLAEWAGVVLPAAPAARPVSRIAALRSATQEAWGAAQAWLETELCEGERARALREHVLRIGADESLLRQARLGYFTPALASHLDRLGIDATIRHRAQLSTAALASIPEGPVLLRTHAGTPSGMSHLSPSGQWIHLTAGGANGDPAVMLAPRGRANVRSLVIAPSMEQALLAAAALRHAGESADVPYAKAAKATGVAVWMPDDLADVTSLVDLTERALIVTAPRDQPRVASTLGAELIRRGFDVRVGLTSPRPGDLDDPDGCADRLLRAPHYLDWQRGLLRTAVPQAAGVGARWTRLRVRPLLAQVTDPTHHAILAHRAAALTI